VLRAGQQPPQAQQGRRSGIVDPPDRKLPWRPEEEARRRQFLTDTNPAKDLNHVEFNARCLLPGLFVGEDGNNPYTFLQRPGAVVILYDYNHTSRVIDLNRREHLGKDIRLFMGDSLGRWEGNTLVVDTTNFNGKIAYSYEIPYLSDALHTVERLTIVDANTIDYEVTNRRPEAVYAALESGRLFPAGGKGRGVARVRVCRRQPDAAEHVWSTAAALSSKHS